VAKDPVKGRKAGVLFSDFLQLGEGVTIKSGVVVVSGWRYRASRDGDMSQEAERLPGRLADFCLIAGLLTGTGSACIGLIVGLDKRLVCRIDAKVVPV